jgi:superkiller protein 3
VTSIHLNIYVNRSINMKTDPLEKVRITKRIEQAQENQLAGDFDAAGAIYHDILAQHPGNPSAMRGMGILCVQQGHFEEAESWLRRATEADPDQARGWNDLGEALRLLGRGEEAAATYRHALELQPTLVEAMNNLAVVLAGQNDLEEAKRWLRVAIEAAPDDPYSHNNLGVIYEAEGELDEALRYYEMAVIRKSSFAEAIENYSSLLVREPERVMGSMTRLLEEAKRL